MVINERDIMVELDSPQLVNLEFAFETKHFVILALECNYFLIKIAQEDNYSTI